MYDGLEPGMLIVAQARTSSPSHKLAVGEKVILPPDADGYLRWTDYTDGWTKRRGHRVKPGTYKVYHVTYAGRVDLATGELLEWVLDDEPGPGPETAIQPATPEMRFDQEVRKLTIDGFPLVFTADWGIPRTELWRPLGYSSKDSFQGVFSRWERSGRLVEGKHFHRGKPRADESSGPVIITEIGLYKVAVLSDTTVGRQLGDFMAEVVLPAIQRGRAVTPQVEVDRWSKLEDRTLRVLEGHDARLGHLEQAVQAVAPIAERVERLEAERRGETTTLVGFCRLKGIRYTSRDLTRLGSFVKKAAARRGMWMSSTPDERWGRVRVYRIKDLEQIFSEIGS